MVCALQTSSPGCDILFTAQVAWEEKLGWQRVFGQPPPAQKLSTAGRKPRVRCFSSDLPLPVQNLTRRSRKMDAAKPENAAPATSERERSALTNAEGHKKGTALKSHQSNIKINMMFDKEPA